MSGLPQMSPSFFWHPSVISPIFSNFFRKFSYLFYVSLKMKMLVTQLCPTLRPQTVACQVPLSMEFFRQEYWSGWPFLSPGDLLDPGIETVTHIAGSFFIIWATREAHVSLSKYLYFWQNFLIIALPLLGFLLIWPFFQNSFRNHLLLSEFPSKITFFLSGFPLI